MLNVEDKCVRCAERGLVCKVREELPLRLNPFPERHSNKCSYCIKAAEPCSLDEAHYKPPKQSAKASKTKGKPSEKSSEIVEASEPELSEDEDEPSADPVEPVQKKQRTEAQVISPTASATSNSQPVKAVNTTLKDLLQSKGNTKFEDVIQKLELQEKNMKEIQKRFDVVELKLTTQLGRFQRLLNAMADMMGVQEN